MTGNWRSYARPFAKVRGSYRAARRYAESKSVRPGDEDARWAIHFLFLSQGVEAAWRGFVEHMRQEGRL